MTAMKKLVLAAVVIAVVLAIALTVYATTREDHQIKRNTVDHIQYSP